MTRFTRRNAAVAALVFGLLLFAAGIFAFLNLNSEIGRTSSAAKTTINVAGRQRSLIQNIVRDLDQISLDRASGKATAADAADLTKKTVVFDRTLSAFINGGVVPLGEGKTEVLKALTDAEGHGLALHTQTLWTSFHKAIGALSNGDLTRASTVAEMGQASVNPIWTDADEIVTHFDNASQANVGALTTKRNLFIFLAVLGTALAIGGLLAVVILDGRERQRIEAEGAAKLAEENARLEEATHSLELAQRNTDAIMSTVRQGLLLIDGSSTILPGYSSELENVFGKKDLAGQEFLDLIKPIVTEKSLEATTRYLKLLFDQNRKERAVLQVNPLEVVDAHFVNADATYTTKNLRFAFRRIMDAGNIVNAFIAIDDITDQVTHERELREAEELKEKQFQLLVGVLHVEPPMLDEFLQTAKDDLAKMTDALRAEEFANATPTLLRSRLDIVFRSVHNIKGNAAFLKLDYFSRVCEGFESEIAALRLSPVLTGDNFLSIVLAQSNLRADVNQLQDLREKFAGFRVAAPGGAVDARPAQPTEESYADPVIGGIAELAHRLASEHGKNVNVRAQDFTLEPLAPEHRRFVKDALIQLARNSIAHGVESPVQRGKSGKPDVAKIEIRRVESEPGTFTFVYRDDGRGLDPEALRAKAVEKGLVSAAQAADMDDVAAIDLIFAPGFSTAAEPTADAGRGMGMDIVRQSVVEECGGRLAVRSKTGAWCEFRFVLPAAVAVMAGSAKA